ncbi:MAG: tyrosine-protein phosphatase [Leucobacter sp.]
MTSTPLPIDGTYNFRDLGGFNADGGKTKSGLIYRSDALDALTDHGRQQVADLSVVRVIDLRDKAESDPLPDLLPPSAIVVPHPIFPDVQAHVSGQLDIYSVTKMIYLQHGDTLGSAITMLTEPGVSVFHCTAGKDRTGAVAALTLMAVGVDRDDVMHDYSLSQQYLTGPWEEKNEKMIENLGIKPTPAILELLVATPIGAIDQALTAIDQKYGSVRDYLRESGVTDETIEKLNTQLVG